jgi:hypothetical protein
VYCGQCGTPNQDEAGHCETCGAPLLITTGARVCGECGAALGDHDRFCTTCGAAASEAAASDGYDAADDFGELNIDDIEIDELPDWLQGMAPVQEHVTSERPRQSDQPTPDDLPDWLRDTPDGDDSLIGAAPAPPPRTPESSSVDHQPAEEFSLLSDDDLPDWLKALSDEDDIDPSRSSTHVTAPAGPRHDSNPSTAVANLYEVPVVSRAWLAQGRSVDQEQVTSARQEFMPLEAMSGVATVQARPQSIWDSEPVEADGDNEETRPFAVPQEDAAESQGRGRLIVRIVILALLVIVVMLIAFLLIQGV